MNISKNTLNRAVYNAGTCPDELNIINYRNNCKINMTPNGDKNDCSVFVLDVSYADFENDTSHRKEDFILRYVSWIKYSM